MVGFEAKLVAFGVVTLQRACHNSFIEWAKGGAARPEYTVSSVICCAQSLSVVIGWCLAYASGGRNDLLKCFDTAILSKFAWIGCIYALGDVFEMESVNYIDSSTYTVLSQSKLITTALLMWSMDGVSQTKLQWCLLFTTSLGLFEYMLVSRKATGAGAVFSFIGVFLAMFKVIVSCYVAVLNTKALKKDSNPFPVQLSALKVSWATSSFVYMIVKDGIFGDGNLFGVWTWRTCVLMFFGFVLKSLFNQYLLKVLDAIWKNISEACGVIVVYFGRIAFLGSVFDGTVFNAALVVIFACISYSLTKTDASEKKVDISQQLNPALYATLRAPLNADATNARQRCPPV